MSDGPVQHARKARARLIDQRRQLLKAIAEGDGNALLQSAAEASQLQSAIEAITRAIDEEHATEDERRRRDNAAREPHPSR